MGATRTAPLRAEQFTSASAAQPLWYRAVNRVGSLLPRSEMPTSEAIFAKARRGSRSSAGPHPDTVRALDALLHSVGRDANLSFAGRIAAKMDCGRMAAQHLAIEQAIQTTPTILDTAIPSPIFLVGWMRTGTTFVHRLMARDPETRTMPYWESMYPVPPRTGKDDRAEELDRLLGGSR